MPINAKEFFSKPTKEQIESSLATIADRAKNGTKQEFEKAQEFHRAVLERAGQTKLRQETLKSGQQLMTPGDSAAKTIVSGMKDAPKENMHLTSGADFAERQAKIAAAAESRGEGFARRHALADLAKGEEAVGKKYFSGLANKVEKLGLQAAEDVQKSGALKSLRNTKLVGPLVNFGMAVHEGESVPSAALTAVGQEVSQSASLPAQAAIMAMTPNETDNAKGSPEYNVEHPTGSVSEERKKRDLMDAMTHKSKSSK